MIKKVYLNQPGRFGDILYIIPMARRLMERGYDVFFLINEKYKSLIPHFPDINFVDPESHPTVIEPYIFLSLWNGATYFQDDPTHKKDIMTDKYAMYNIVMKDNIDPKSYWRKLTFKRFPEKEKLLFKILGLKDGEKYVLINENSSNGTKKIDVKTDLKKVYMGMEGELKQFDLLDWSLVMENAEEIHTIHTSVIYVLEVLKTTSKLHLYERIKGKVPITHILNKDYIQHD